MREKITAGGFGFFGAFADAGSRGDDEEGEMIAADGIFVCTVVSGDSGLGGQDVIAQAELVGDALALKMEFVDRRSFSRLEQGNGIPLTFRLEELPHG